jgi:predicted nucleic acid-binding protein
MHCLVEFYAKVTHPRVYKPASTTAQALEQVEIWFESPSLQVLTESAQTWSVTRDLLAAAQIAGDPAYDARIAAVCLQHGVTELWTTDRDYLRFPALRVRNPLIDIQPTRAGERPATYGVPRRRPRTARKS